MSFQECVNLLLMAVQLTFFSEMKFNSGLNKLILSLRHRIKPSNMNFLLQKEAGRVGHTINRKSKKRKGDFLFGKIGLLFLLMGLFFKPTLWAQNTLSPWPEITQTTKTWTRWWWMGSAVDKESIKRSLIDFQQAGLGGVEITPIYGVQGQADKEIPFLSARWMEMLNYTLQTADSLGLGVDMVLGTGWPYGGAHVPPALAATKILIEKIPLAKGTTIEQKLEPQNTKERPGAKLLYVLAFGADGSYQDLTPTLQQNEIKFKAKRKNYTLYAVFEGKTRQQVKRAAPGGAGFTLDHYSKTALQHYVKPFEKAFAQKKGTLRSIFNDSYEVYNTDFTPAFFEAFQQRRGYDLKPLLPLLLDTLNHDLGNRVKSDYRETLSDLLLEEFTQPWTDWAHQQHVKSRLQAHGSPGNLIDLYAAADIPECETFGSMPYDIKGFRRDPQNIRSGDADPVMLKFSSSAAHIAGKNKVSAESFTWLREHFKTALSQCKPEAEDLLLNGINHLFLHGSTYSPQAAAWPGWKFYASVNFNATNPIWEDASALFAYIARCQSLLQAGQPDNEVLLYWPIHEVWARFLKGSLFHQFKIHSLDEWLYGTSFYEMAKKLMQTGYGVDFISDQFLSKATVENGKLRLPGGLYHSLVVPQSDQLPLKTVEKLIQLKKEGAHIIFEGLPNTVPGYHNFEARTATLRNLIAENATFIAPTPKVVEALKSQQLLPEQITQTGLKFIRRAVGKEKTYFLVNHTNKAFEGFLPLQVKTNSVLLMDPQHATFGKAKLRDAGQRVEVYVQIPSGGSVFLKTAASSNMPNWKYWTPMAQEYILERPWQLEFKKGGPQRPPTQHLEALGSWTTLGPMAEAFSGTAHYTTTFPKPNRDAAGWKLDLGEVRESAQVWLNGKAIGTAWAPPYELILPPLAEENTLTIAVTNLGANRIRAKERSGEEWKIFNEINMVNKDYKPFDAAVWEPMPSGLLDAVKLIPLQPKTF